jgi:hypothetical protein
MPRLLVLVVLSGCWFDADYGNGHFTCTDGVCPGGQVCNAAKVCVAPGDGGVDAPGPDARIAAATCADPMPFPATGGTFTGTTAGRQNLVTASCAGFVMNGLDAVYRIDTAAGDHLLVTITGGLQAYVITPCTAAPATPACVGNAVASAGNPIDVTTAAGPQFIVVDDANPATSGPYTLSVTH